MICDDAPQFKNITELLGLCWVHDGRHYKKIIPFLKDSKIKLENFILKYWNYYKSLKKYKDNPTIEMKERLSKDFDILFSIKTGYLELDKRIEKTKNKKSELLLILDYPEIPLHNNAAELAVRVQVRKRDVSLQTRTEQ
ncbi:transposase [Candidatus Woesearchaeota archaeon]|nr:transposase [Candidatus Woesearchaeota archaeon]